MTEEGQRSEAEKESPGLRTGLADIDRKLRALQDELAASDPEGLPARAEAEAAPAPAERVARAPAPLPPTVPPPRPPRDDSARTAEDLALAIIARAEEQASRIVDEAHDRVVALNRQAEQLMALRDGLRRSARELLDGYAAALEQIERDATGGAGAPVAAPHSPPRAEEPAGVAGTVTISAEPFAQVADLAAFTQALERVPGATATTVQGFDGRRAEVAVTLTQPVALVRELYRVMPFAVEVAEEREGFLALRLEVEAAG